MLITEMSIIIILMIFLFLIGMPIAFVLAGAGIVGILFHHGVPGLYQFAYQFWHNGGNFLLICIPLFIHIAVVLEKGKVGYMLFDVAAKWLRGLPGGLGVSTVGASALFSALSGTSVATAATVGLIAYPEMTARGYPKRITMGILSAGGGLGMLIPPSVPLIVYGAITGESIGKLFIAGIGPGILLAVLYALMVVFRALRGDINVVEPKATWKEKIDSIKKAIWGLALIPIMIGGLYAGFFTPTEAGAVGLVLAVLVVSAIYRTLNLKELVSTLGTAMRTSVMIYTIILGAGLFSYMMTLYGIPTLVTEWVLNMKISPIGVILMLNLVLLILGCFLEVTALMLMTVPMLYPIVTGLGFDGVWFGIVLMVNFNMAVETPPVGLNLYVLKGIDPDLPLAEIIKGVIPFYFCEILGLLLVIFFPVLSLWLVRLMPG